MNQDLQAFGLAAAGGYVSTTGVPGLTLGGGLGWLVRKHGLACDNLRSADVVTADGELVRASATENTDLFWGLRGGGGNFGVVTSFEFDVHTAGIVQAGLLIYPLPGAKETLRFWREYARSAPEELTSGGLLITAPAAPFVPPEAHGVPVLAVYTVYAGPLDAGEQALRPLREFGPPTDLSGLSYVVLTLIGRNGAGPHDLVQMARAGQRLYWAGAASKIYAQPKWLEERGYLTSEKTPGKTRERTHYTLTDKGLTALREWLARPSSFPRIQNEAAIRVQASDLAEDPTLVVESLRSLRAEIAELETILDDAEARARDLPHRERQLRLLRSLGRRLLRAHLEWLDEVEQELARS